MTVSLRVKIVIGKKKESKRPISRVTVTDEQRGKRIDKEAHIKRNKIYKYRHSYRKKKHLEYKKYRE